MTYYQNDPTFKQWVDANLKGKDGASITLNDILDSEFLDKIVEYLKELRLVLRKEETRPKQTPLPKNKK